METHFKIFHIVLLIAATTVGAFAKTNSGGNCNFLNSSPGICQRVDDCPLIAAIWKEVVLEISVFKSLICGEDYSTGETLVCCPKSEKDRKIEDEDIKEQQSLDDNKIYFPDDPELFDDVDDFHHVAYESHRNFHLLPSLNECGSKASLPFDRIIGGTNAAHAEYPWLAQIGYVGSANDEMIFDCGGAVLNKKYILTAAHCLHHKNFQPVLVRLAEYKMSTDPDCSTYFNCSTAKDFEIEKIIVHENYKQRNSSEEFNDIALIRVKNEIAFDTPFIKPICLPFGKDYDIVNLLNEDSTKNKMAIAAGWGRTDWQVENGSDVLQNVFLRVNTFEDCKEDYENQYLQISPKQTCVGGEVEKDACAGDSGGPIMLPLAIRTHKNTFSLKIFQLGIISYGPEECGKHAFPGIATRVTAYLDWILNNISS